MDPASSRSPFFIPIYIRLTCTPTINLWLIHYQSLKFRSLPMPILLEEAPLLVYYFLTLFLSNYKLRLILSIFWTTSTFCQLELPCSLCSLRSLGRSLAHFVHCTRWDAHLLTSFAVLAGTLTCSLCSLRSLGRSLAHFVRCARAIALTSFRAWRSLTLTLKAPLGRYTTSAHYVRTCCIAYFHRLVLRP